MRVTLILYKVYVWFCFCTKTVSTFFLQTQAHKVYWEVAPWYPDGVLIFQSRSEKTSAIRLSTCMLALAFSWGMYYIWQLYLHTWTLASMRLKQLHLWCLRCIPVSVAWNNLESSTLPWSGCRFNLRDTPAVHVCEQYPFYTWVEKTWYPKIIMLVLIIYMYTSLGEERHYNSIKLHI